MVPGALSRLRAGPLLERMRPCICKIVRRCVLVWRRLASGRRRGVAPCARALHLRRIGRRAAVGRVERRGDVVWLWASGDVKERG